MRFVVVRARFADLSWENHLIRLVFIAYFVVLFGRPGLAVESGASSQDSPSLVDLTPQQQTSIDDSDTSNVLSNPWWRNLDISGFASAGYYDTGSAGTRPNGGFEIKEVSLFVTAEVWGNIDFFMELQANRLGKDEDKFTRTGEVYVHFHDVAVTDGFRVGIKLGRIDIPFGEEYLWRMQ